MIDRAGNPARIHPEKSIKKSLSGFKNPTGYIN
jgi:hypothetical protein